MVFKRGKKGTYYVKFMWQGKTVFRSAHTTNPKIARQVEAAARNALAKGNAGILERKPVPTLEAFCDCHVEPWARSLFENSCPNNWLWYRAGLGAIRGCKPIAILRLDQITSEKAAEFAAYRLTQGLQISSVNSTLRVLRRVFSLAVEWGVLDKAAKIKLLPGERHRERVVTPQEEARYLAVTREPLTSVAISLADTGVRPDECYRLRWEDITWSNARHGTLLVTHGKTAAARRVLPMTPRVRLVLEGRGDSAGRPQEGWIWPAPTRTGHVNHSSLKKAHLKALQLSGVRFFVLYSLRHTFLTRLGQSGCDAWTLARIAGHSSISMSKRYVHPSEDAVLDAIERLQGTGCNFGSNRFLPSGERDSERTLTPEPVYNYEQRARSSVG